MIEPKSSFPVFTVKDWGQRHFCIQDPNGVYLDTVQSFEPTHEYRSDYVSE